ncbi:MAG TPA: FHA domain-containing protein [Streptosporangiaceae bacterium]|nr:FHA domain-containing protein [Streptosporangiaceae bacterium]
MCALPATLGRDSGTAAVVLDDRDVSRRHARIEIVDNELVLTDLGSTNGTYVNDARVARRVLVPGDRMRIGRYELTWALVDPQATVAVSPGQLTAVRQPTPSEEHSAAPSASPVGALVLTGLGAGLQIDVDDHSVLPWVAVAFVLYLAAVIITLAVNVPLNDAIKAAGNPDRVDDLAAVRSRFSEAKWAAWNVVRALVSTAAFGCLAGSLVEYGALS